MTKRPSLRGNVTPDPANVAEKLAERAQWQFSEEEEWTTSSVHLPGELLDMLQDAAIRMQRQRRRRGEKPGRASVSQVLRDVLVANEAKIRTMYTD